MFAPCVVTPGRHAQSRLATSAAITKLELRRALQPNLKE
jgi:hypothetical protein